MALAPGTRLGPYTISASIGAGGMGEVYKATDTRLDRTVAVKVLPEHVATDPDLKQRFEREAKTLAALSHPHICPIHDVGSQNGIDFLVMEYLEGETLEQRLKKGALPLDQSLKTGIQIADALTAAHRASIVHRDLKPGNIMLTKSGAKLLDFGLAKAGAAAVAGSLSMLPTTPPNLTAQGAILGTFQYMAPEQLEGQEADARTDMFAFGAVLYEMVTGKKAFEGKSQASLIAAILEREPPAMSTVQPLAPPALDRVVKKCLAKERERRWQSASDLTDELRWIIEANISHTPGSTLTSPPSDVATGRWRLVVLGGLLTGAAMAGVVVRNLNSLPSPTEIQAPAAHLQVVLPAGVHVAVDTDHPAIALSPDGSQLVFVGDEGGRRQLYVRDLVNPDARVLPGTEGASSPFYSPDGLWVGFFDGGVLKKISPEGGVPVAVHASTATSVNRGATWALDETVIFAQSPNSGLSRGSMAGDRLHGIAEWTWITDNTRPYAWPHALPDNDHVLFTDSGSEGLDDARVALLSLGTGQVRALVQGGTNPRYSPTGHVVFARAGALYAVPFDINRPESTGPEQLLVDGVMTEPNGATQFTVAGNGTLAYVAGQATPTQHEVVWVDRAGRTQPLLDDGRMYEDPRLSPDGTRLAFTTWDGANSDVWFRDLTRGSNTRVTTHPGEDFEPAWSPDGQRLAFASEIGEDLQNPGPALAWITAFDQRPEQLLQSPGFGNWEFPTSWSQDGRWLAVTRTMAGTARDIMLFPTAGPREAIAFLETPAVEEAATFSPDGHWIAYVSNETGREEVYVRPFPGPGASITISTESGVEPRWGRNGRELFYRSNNKMMAVKVAGGTGFVASTPTTLFEGRFEMKGYGGSSANYDVASDGRFVMVRRKNPVTPTVIQVVFNWPHARGTR